jgi:hypothetical protein
MSRYKWISLDGETIGPYCVSVSNRIGNTYAGVVRLSWYQLQLVVDVKLTTCAKTE